jgi:hypothetical protein
VAEREDRGESTERRDFELPPDTEPAPAGGPPPDAADEHPEPADESERRDWDLPAT